MADDAPVVVCIDATSLAVLQLSREGASRWAWPDSSPLRPPGKPRPARNAALDRSRRELEAEAAAEFAEAGGGSSAASLAWRQVFVRRRLALVVSGAIGALSGMAPPEPERGTAALTRKKDAPEHGDAEGVRRFLAAQAEQSALADRRCARGRPRQLVAAAARLGLGVGLGLGLGLGFGLGLGLGLGFGLGFGFGFGLGLGFGLG